MTTVATSSAVQPITARGSPRPRRPMISVVTRVLFVIALIAFTLDLVLRTIQRGLFTWRKDL